jgi:endonuclease I
MCNFAYQSYTMLAKHFLLIISLFVFFTSHAQQLNSTFSRLTFGTVQTGITDSLPLTLSISELIVTSDSSIEVKQLFCTHPAFSVLFSPFTITPSQPKTIWVRFKPKHNTQVAGHLYIVSNARNVSMSVGLSGSGTYNEPYYAATQNLSEEALKTALKTIISTGQASCSYNGSRDYMFMTLDNQRTNGGGASQNTLECVYTGRQAIGYTNRQDAQTNDNFNTEHTWPQSLFNSATPMQCDLHHLFPTDETANSTRSNYPFGTVNNPIWNVGGSKFNGAVFEPRNEHKGAVARAMMYFVLRYQDYANFFAPQESILREWHLQYAPTAAHRNRNESIFTFQNNRNPFIDHPEFIERISVLAGNSTAPVVRKITIDTSAVEMKVIGGATILLDSVSLSLANSGNTSFNYVAGLSDPRFAVANEAAAIVAPDSSKTLVIKYNSMGSNDTLVKDTLRLVTNIPGQSVISIPIVAKIDITSSVEEVGLPTFHIYPNPSSDQIHISSQYTGDYRPSLFTLQGKQLTIPATQQTLFVQSVQNGMYVLRIQIGERYQYYPILIQH